ncbi:ArsR/SmtB family transcription factor [Micromonospora sp. NPDC005203]|uniref:ArsR/SmtB family transcription factor n=1 Tax=Micromonospora sp. NPDC005203 TaxID=3364226 RepID=UPI00369D0422
MWSAIGDPTRRTMIDLLLSDGPGTATSLSRRLPVTRQAVAKHLAADRRDDRARPPPRRTGMTMVNILHQVGVVAPLDDLYQAVASPGGVAGRPASDDVQISAGH